MIEIVVLIMATMPRQSSGGGVSSSLGGRLVLSLRLPQGSGAGGQRTSCGPERAKLG